MSHGGSFIPMSLQEQFGSRVKELRLQLNLSQEAFAYKAGIDRTYVTGIETGRRNVSLQIIEKVIKGLEVTPTTFFNSPIFQN